MHKKTSFLRDFQKNRLFACVFCVFFASSALASLPAGFTELEYLESTGTQYIDTGIKPNNNTKITAYFKSTNTSVTQALIGARNFDSGDERNSFSIWENVTGHMRFDYQSNPVNQGRISTTDWNYAVKENKDNYLNGVKLGSNSENTFTCDYPLVINAVNTKGIIGNIGTTTFGVVEIYQNGTSLSFKGIPAKRISDNVVGMYDIANSGKNLFDKSLFSTDTGNTMVFTVFNVPNGTYTMSTPDFPMIGGTTNVFFMAGSKSEVQSGSGVSSTNPVTVTVTDGKYTVGHRYISGTTNINHPIDFNWQIEQGSTATSYEPYPFYTNAGTGTFVAGPKKSISDIQIATTKFVDDEFKAAEDQLATTVQTIESVVSRTITQTGQIQVLQDTKQTRPDESCPANMKCLLVQDEDGTPHWYPIIEP